VLLAREALFLGCGNDRAVHDKCRGTVVIKGREPEDGRHYLEQRVDERCNGSPRREHYQSAEDG
jgi:hypothetical protein